MHWLPHINKICNDCELTWFSEEESLISPCPKCGSFNVSNEHVSHLETFIAWVFAFLVIALVVISIIGIETPLGIGSVTNKPITHIQSMESPNFKLIEIALSS
jgi:hypothetical protein